MMTAPPTLALPLLEDSLPGYALMNEKLLAYIWRLKLYDYRRPLVTSAGRQIQVINCGFENMHAGPDFLQARLHINGVEWIGNIEIHTRASHWYSHRHDNDAAYGNVILHVVYENDRDVVLHDGRLLEVLELKHYLTHAQLIALKDVYLASNRLACQNHIRRARSLTLDNVYDRMAVTRLEEKAGLVLDQLNLCRGDWDEVCYRVLCKSFGFKVNSPAFELLANRLSYRLLAKYTHHPTSVEALLFGTAGLLGQDNADDYIGGLTTEYRFLMVKHGLQPLEASVWKFLRMRPAGFPTMRLAQLAGVLLKHTRLFNTLLECGPEGQRALFTALPVSAYWNTHYIPGRGSPRHSAAIGSASIDSLLINAAAPLLYAYSRATRQDGYREKAMQILEGLKPEHNHVTAMFATFGVGAANALQTQGLLQLYNTQCTPKLCTACPVLADILNHKQG